MAENKHRGPTLDSFLEEEGVLAEFQAKAIKEVIAWQLAEAMRERIGLQYRVAETVAARDLSVSMARETLGEPAFTEAWTAGRSLQPDQAIAEARLPIAPPVIAPRWSLTSREQDVLRLLAQGMKDPEIADALFLSVRTVENHVAHILDKIGVRTRTAAVSAAVAAGLVAGAQPPA